jgi:hypothetical protein
MDLYLDAIDTQHGRGFMRRLYQATGMAAFSMSCPGVARRILGLTVIRSL